MAKDIQYYQNKLLVLRSAIDDVLAEMAKETPAPPVRKRQNLKDKRVLDFHAFYMNLEQKKANRLK